MTGKLLILKNLEELRDDINRTFVGFNREFSESPINTLSTMSLEEERSALLKKMDEVSDHLSYLISAGKEFGIV